MARAFNGTNQSATLAGINQYPFPFTIYCRGYSNNTTAEQALATFTNSSQLDDFVAVSLRGDTVGDPVQMRRSNASAVDGTNGAAYVANTWIDVCGVVTSATNVAIYADGAKTTDTASITYPVTFPYSTFSISSYFTSGGRSGFLNGRSASIAFWTDALTDDEVTSLARGFPPRRIRPQSLQLYLPYIRDGFEWRGWNPVYTEQNSPTVADHPRSYAF